MKNNQGLFIQKTMAYYLIAGNVCSGKVFEHLAQAVDIKLLTLQCLWIEKQESLRNKV